VFSLCVVGSLGLADFLGILGLGDGIFGGNILDTHRSMAAGGNLGNSGTKRGGIANDGGTFFVFVFCELDHTFSETSFWNCNCAGLKFEISGSLYRN